MTRPHARLRGVLEEHDIDEQHLARILLRGVTYVSQRMMGKKPWPLDECYKILDVIHEPYTALPEYFPPGGIKPKEVKPCRGSATTAQSRALLKSVTATLRKPSSCSERLYPR